MFDVGEKVVCVDGKFPDRIKKLYTDLPKENQVYVVRDIVAGQNYNLSATIAVLLIGMTGQINQHGVENGFSSHRFRRLDEIKKINKAKKSQKQPTKS